ncbi:phage minor head protein [uncultured Sphaerochaeta sp.]|uniref:phage minor head protein n=1 Tax=uncultured Sphaerochaeta sp. TaxID=886478 RepID=UPI002A0A8702|nr:phage minor head protein [uncultured Sphaerochaeta sp.]
MARDLYTRLYGNTQVELAKLMDEGELEIVRQYGIVLQQCRDKLDRIYKTYSKDGKLNNAAMSKANRLTSLQDDIEAILKEKVPSVTEYTRDLTEEMYKASFYRHAYIIDQAGGMSLSWGLVPRVAVERAIKGKYDKFAKSKMLSMPQKEAIAAIRKDLGQAIIRGDSYPVLAKRIANHIGVDVKRAKAIYGNKGMAAWSITVARTEGQRVLVEGQDAAYEKARELGCDVIAIWDATLDGRTRAAHAALDGQERNEAKGGWDVPGIGVVSAPLHSGVASFDVNCRCRLRSQVKGYPPGERYIRGDGITAYQTFEQWEVTQKTKVA